ncbi:hypothetical protein M9H77_27175 [Catharanthus roseus]|uniref:Uncharacterized protein n=1 Tax=Catharanthus roseus TaxID=4058 RepID=A0ACC0AEG7_CATRO|nr:hypothetical protein M9H77_27175 [Catharanthus roseus]
MRSCMKNSHSRTPSTIASQPIFLKQDTELDVLHVLPLASNDKLIFLYIRKDFMACSLRNYTCEKDDVELSSKEKGDRTARENEQSIEYVEEFYSCHSKMVGFSVRKDDLIWDEKDRITYMC